MGIIMGALGGIGKGMAEIGGGMMASAQQDEQLQKKMQFDRQMMQERSAIEVQAQENLARLKIRMAEEGQARSHGRINDAAKGIVGGQFNAARDAYAKAEGLTDQDRSLAREEIDRNEQAMMRDPSIQKQAAIQAGEYGVAEILHKLDDKDSKVHNVPFGSVAVNSKGEILFDNSSEYKKALEQQRVDAQTARAGVSLYKAQGGGTAGRKPLTDAQQLALEQKLTTTIDKQYSERNKAHPFDLSDDPSKPDVDSPRRDMVKMMVENGVKAKGYDTFNENLRNAEKLVGDFDRELTAQARAKAAADMKNMKPQDREKLIAQGVPPNALMSEKHLARYLRDKEFTKENIEKFYVGNQAKYDGKQEEKKGVIGKQTTLDTTKADATKPAEKKPEPKEPEKKPEPKPAPKKSEPTGTFAERQKKVLEDRKKADNDTDLQRLEAQRKKALRDGKPVEANNIIEKFKTLRLERYGF